MTNSACSIDLFDVAIPMTFDDIVKGPLDVFVVTFVLNPYGPTLTYVGTIGRGKPGQVLPLVWVTLNPFSQKTFQLGSFIVGDTWQPTKLLAPLLVYSGKNCPTLILVNQNAREAERDEVLDTLLRQYPNDVAHICREITSHFGDPWSRISALLASGRQPTEIPLDVAIARLRRLLIHPAHVKNELDAFLAAWDGAIEHSDTDKRRSHLAFSMARLKSYLYEQLLPTVWLPAIAENDCTESLPSSETDLPQAFEPVSLEQVRKVLHSDDWRGWGQKNLVALLDASILLYGSDTKAEDIQFIGHLYRRVLQAGVNVESRLAIESRVLELVEKKSLSIVSFLPFLVQDSDQAVVSKTTIDFVCASPYSGSELYAIKELRPLFFKKILENRAVVFGALVSMGDMEFTQLIDEMRVELSTDEVRRAARVHTNFLQHHAIQFWLGWAKDLIAHSDNDSLANFGSCASALVACWRHVLADSVFDGKRQFPCASFEKPITLRKTWSRAEYADLLANDFYNLENRESAPKVFSHVLRAWGLRPRALLEDQFLPEGVSPEDGLHLLRDPFDNRRSGPKPL